MPYSSDAIWEVEYTSEFEDWWRTLSSKEQDAIDRAVRMIRDRGPHLGHPYSSQVKSSRHGNMRELRVQCGGDPYRVLYAFDPRRIAIVLLGGCKRGDDRWYDRNVPIADDLYDTYLTELKREGLL